MNPDPRYPLAFYCQHCRDMQPVYDFGGNCRCGESYARIRGMGMVDVAGPIEVYVIRPLGTGSIRRLDKEKPQDGE